jgi:four helix bundle protein
VETTEAGTIKNFTDLRVWQKSHDLFVAMYRAADGLPQTPAAAILLEQMLQKSGSISAKIAEGFSAREKYKYVQCLDKARRRVAETENWLHTLIDCGCYSHDIVKPWLDRCLEISRMLSSLIRKLEERNKIKPQVPGDLNTLQS